MRRDREGDLLGTPSGWAVLTTIMAFGSALWVCDAAGPLYQAEDPVDSGRARPMMMVAADDDAGEPDVVPQDASPYVPPPTFDAGTTWLCTLPTPGVNVPCVRWAPQGSCWFLSSIPGSLLDDLCEDQLPPGGWCEILGDDWGLEQGLSLGPGSMPCCDVGP